MTAQAPHPRPLSWLLPAAVALSLSTMLLTTCGSGTEEPPRDQPAGVVDSTFPIEEEIRRFVATVDSVPSTLRGGAPTRDELVARFVAAVEARDSAALGQLVLQRDEFIGVYYSHTPFTAPPYELSPALLWFQMQNISSRGISRLLQRDGGRPLGALSHRCEAAPRDEGPNRLWDGCVVVVRDSAGGRRDRQLFGTILERGGRFKFLTFANEY